MKIYRLVLTITATLTFSLFAAHFPVASQEEMRWAFEKDAHGRLPAGFSAAVGEWKVVPSGEAQGNVLAQTFRNAGPVYNVALVDATRYADLELSVKLMAIGGEVDQGGGVVWRAADAENYYIARHNPLEENFCVYKVVGGRRTQLHTASVSRSPGWHVLRVTMRGDAIECFLDGRKYLEAKDSTLAGPGKIGLWSKADAQTWFDDLTVKPLAK